ncbi:MAG: hypothetical protein WBD87_16560 [Candidatus Acidiferrales bacterium]
MAWFYNLIFVHFLKIGLVASSRRHSVRPTGYIQKSAFLLAFSEKWKIRACGNRQKGHFSMACFTRPISAIFACGKRQFGLF